MDAVEAEDVDVVDKEDEDADVDVGATAMLANEQAYIVTLMAIAPTPVMNARRRRRATRTTQPSRI
jgi:hypothetical protein